MVMVPSDRGVECNSKFTSAPAGRPELLTVTVSPACSGASPPTTFNTQKNRVWSVDVGGVDDRGRDDRGR